MVRVRTIVRNWIIGFALGFVLFGRVREETSRVRAGLAWGTIAAVGGLLRARRAARRAAGHETETAEVDEIAV